MIAKTSFLGSADAATALEPSSHLEADESQVLGPDRTAERPGTQAQTGKRRLWVVALLGPAVLLPLWLLPWDGTQTQPTLPPLTFVLSVIVVLITSATDLRWRRIPNWLSYPGFLWGVALNLLHSFAASDALANRLGTVGVGDSLLGASALFVASLLILGLTGGGAGDVKLLTALGALLGLDRGVDVMLYGFVAAGVGSLAWAIWAVGPVAIFRALGRWVGGFILPRWFAFPTVDDKRLLLKPIPLAPFFAVGTLLVCCGLPLAELSRLFGK